MIYYDYVYIEVYIQLGGKLILWCVRESRSLHHRRLSRFCVRLC